MVRCKTAGARKGNGSAESVYTLEQLPDEKKKRYHSLLEDFDKQVKAHIEEARAEMEKMMKQIQNAYRVEIFKLPKDQKNLIQEELVLKNMEEKQKKDGKSIRESSIFQSNMAKVSESVDNLVTKEVAKVEKSAKKKGRGGVSTIKKSKPKRSFSEPAPPSTVRRSTRKRMPSERSILAMETPHAGPGMAKGPLTSTAYSNRIRGVGTRKGMLMETPCNPNYTSAFADVSHVLPAITPKFDLATPLHKQFSVMRTANADETVISLRGSPINVGQTTARKNRRGKIVTPMSPVEHVSIKIGDGKKLVIPTDLEVGADENAPPLDLDADALKKIKALRDKLANILQNAGNDTTMNIGNDTEMENNTLKC